MPLSQLRPPVPPLDRGEPAVTYRSWIRLGDAHFCRDVIASCTAGLSTSCSRSHAINTDIIACHDRIIANSHVTAQTALPCLKCGCIQSFLHAGLQRVNASERYTHGASRPRGLDFRGVEDRLQVDSAGRKLETWRWWGFLKPVLLQPTALPCMTVCPS